MWLTGVGKMFCPEFEIDDTNRRTFHILFDYFTGSDNELEPSKGLLIQGAIGSGKTLAMKIFGTLFKIGKIVSCRSIVWDFMQNIDITKYGKGVLNQHETAHTPKVYCFDDIGLEKTSAKSYGNEVHAISEILLDRYDLLMNHGIKTYGTTNLDLPSLSTTYGERVSDRLKEMFNIVVFEGASRRKPNSKVKNDLFEKVKFMQYKVKVTDNFYSKMSPEQAQINDENIQKIKKVIDETAKIKKPKYENDALSTDQLLKLTKHTARKLWENEYLVMSKEDRDSIDKEDFIKSKMGEDYQPPS